MARVEEDRHAGHTGRRARAGQYRAGGQNHRHGAGEAQDVAAGYGSQLSAITHRAMVTTAGSTY
ncbi:hypothetical protein MAHJHV64_32300 [Mycobacterium avium subsp. hominissuis]